MSAATLVKAAQPTIPTATTSQTLPSAASTALDLSAFVGSYVQIRATSAFALRASSSAVSATAGDMPYSADTAYPFLVTNETKHVGARGAAAGTIYVAKVNP